MCDPYSIIQTSEFAHYNIKDITGAIVYSSLVSELEQLKSTGFHKAENIVIETFVVYYPITRNIKSFSAIVALYLLSFVETPRKFIIAELSIRKLGSSSVLIIRLFEFTRPFLYIKCRDCMLA